MIRRNWSKRHCEDNKSFDIDDSIWRKCFIKLIKVSIVAFCLFWIFFADGTEIGFPPFSASLLKEVILILGEPAMQRIVFVCVGIYYSLFTVKHARTFLGCLRIWSQNPCLVVKHLSNIVVYFIDYPSKPTRCLTIVIYAHGWARNLRNRWG